MTLGTITLPSGFEEAELTALINRLPFTPTLLGDERVFSEAPISTTKAMLDVVNGKITLLPDVPRGTPGAPYQRAQRKMVSVACSHFPTRARITADSYQDARGFGTADLEDIVSVQTRYLTGMRANLDATIEYQRMQSLTGLVTDVTGTVTLDLFATFGVVQQVQSLALSVTTTNVPNLIQAAKRKAEQALGAGIKPKGWLAVVAPDMLDALRAHSSLTPSFQGWQAAVALRDDVRNDFNITGVRFAEVLNSDDTTLPAFLAAGTGYLVPLGVPDLCQTYFGPADYLDAVNKTGLPYHVKASIDPKFGKYIDLEAQSNPISVITRPRAIVKLTVA